MVAVSLKKKKKQKNFSLLPPTTHRSPILFFVFFFFQAEDGIRDSSTSRGLGDVYKRQAESIIKERKALFSKNYKTAKRVQSLSASGDFDEAKNLMIEMSKNYVVLLGLFPDNSKEGFKTGSLPTIWEDKDSFNTPVSYTHLTLPTKA